MIKAIVFQSNAGHAQRYAELFSAKSGLPCYALDLAYKSLPSATEIVFFGWLMAGVLKGYEKAAKYFIVKAVCAVGMQAQNEKISHEICGRYHIKDTPVFYFRGGIDPAKLSGLYKMMIKTVMNGMNKAAAKPDAKVEDIEGARMFAEAKDYVAEENLEELFNWYTAQNTAEADMSNQ